MFTTTMKRSSWILFGSLVIASAAACSDSGKTDAPVTAASDAPAATASASASATATAAVSAEPTATAEATATASAAADATATAATTAAAGKPVPAGTGAAATATAAPTASAKAASKYACGGKGQKACPMQGWMKGVMARAIASGDKDKIAKALNTIAAKPVAGMSQWSGIAATGAAAAAGGNIDGAKASCKKCHALYQKRYKTTMRDRPW